MLYATITNPHLCALACTRVLEFLSYSAAYSRLGSDCWVGFVTADVLKIWVVQHSQMCSKLDDLQFIPPICTECVRHILTYSSIGICESFSAVIPPSATTLIPSF